MSLSNSSISEIFFDLVLISIGTEETITTLQPSTSGNQQPSTSSAPSPSSSTGSSPGSVFPFGLIKHVFTNI